MPLSVQDWRTTRGLTQAKVTTLFGISQTYIWLLENWQRRVWETPARRLAVLRPDQDPEAVMAKLCNLQNRLGFLLASAGLPAPGMMDAVAQRNAARLLRESTLCWDSMPASARDWIRQTRSPLAADWNVVTTL